MGKGRVAVGQRRSSLVQQGGGWVEQGAGSVLQTLFWWLSAELCFASQVFFIESVCNDPNVVATNVMVSVELVGVSFFCFPSLER